MSSLTYSIRRGRPDDLDAVSAIEEACFPPAEACSREQFRKRLAVFADHFWLCETPEGVAGFVDGAVINSRTIADVMYEDASLHDPHGAWQAVYGINVLSSCRRQGIGAALMRAVIDAARSEGRRGCVLTCKDEKIAWYAKLGFVLIGRSASVHGGAVWNDMILEFAQDLSRAPENEGALGATRALTGGMSA